MPVVKLAIGVAGIEPATFPPQTERATAALHTVDISIIPRLPHHVKTERTGLEPARGFIPRPFSRRRPRPTGLFPIEVLNGLQSLSVLLYADALLPEKQDLQL